MTGLLLSGTQSVHEGEVQAILARMTNTLALRGPDARGTLRSGPAAFGHTRLSIIDLSAAGAQPMRLADEGPMLTYNGEVYNFMDLRRRLEALGHVNWRGHSDTEVILRTYAQWGLDGLKQLEGMFALALWDPQLQRLVLMRDRLGIKPLYHASSRLGLAFGSEIKAVLAAGGVDQSLDEQSFSEYLWYGNTHGVNTIYQGVKALAPGHWMVVEPGKTRIEPWWQVEDWLKPCPVNTLDEAADLLRDTLDKAVSRQLVSDVPIGLFLSGGIDSSVIAASAMHQRNEPLHSFTAGFDFKGGTNELGKAAQVAKHLGLVHSEIQVSGQQLEPILNTLAKAHDEPFADAANIALYLMCRRLKGEVKVILQGDGGDELFAGYRRYALLANLPWWQCWPNPLTAWMQHAGSRGQRLARIADTLKQSNPALRMAFLMTMETRHAPPERLFQTAFRQHLQETTDPFLPYRQAALRFADHDPVQQMLLTDLTVQLPSQFLPKVDRATMAAGMEVRVPLLDEHVLRLALNLPSSWKVKGVEKKYVLRRSQAERLPANILNGPKDGFDIPYDHWLRTSLHDFAKERLLDPAFCQTYALESSALEETLGRHKTGAVGGGFLLWKLLQLALWDAHQERH